MTICKTPTCNTEIPTRKFGSGKQKVYCDACKKRNNAACSLRTYYRKNINAGRRARAAAMKAETEPAPPPEVVTIEAYTIGSYEALRKLTCAVIMLAVREVRDGCKDAAQWLTSPDAELYLDALDIHPEQVRNWANSEMEMILP